MSTRLFSVTGKAEILDRDRFGPYQSETWIIGLIRHPMTASDLISPKRGS
jgi:hypothetical protein